MKQLFLLPLLTLTFSACTFSVNNKEPSANQSVQVNEEWKLVESNYTLGVYYGKDIMVYMPEDYDYVAYQLTINETTNVNVKRKAKGSEIYKVDTFIGNNISIIIWCN